MRTTKCMRPTLEKTERFNLISLSDIKGAFDNLVKSLEWGGIKHREDPVRDSHLVAGIMAMICAMPLPLRLQFSQAALDFLNDIQELDAEYPFVRAEKSEVVKALTAIKDGSIPRTSEFGLGLERAAKSTPAHSASENRVFPDKSRTPRGRR